MAIFAITTNAAVNQPPNQIGTKILNLDYNQLYVFTVADFTTGTIPVYQDPEGDAAEQIKILLLPTIGTLSFNSGPVISGDEYLMTDIAAGLLTYQCDPADLDGYTDNTMTFDLSDEGSSTFAGLIGGVVFNVKAKENEPPTEVGDGSATIDYGETLVFTTSMFTTGTTPPYSDPESDPANQLKILSLPIKGILKLNGINVTINQIISFSDIALNLFTYTPDLANTDGDFQTFSFSIADAGSGIFVE